MKRFIPIFAFLILAGTGLAQTDSSVPVASIRDGVVKVTTSIGPLPEKLKKEIQSGLPKQMEFQIDVMRAWDRWMDEYIDGITVVRSVKYDVLKKEYRLSSLEGRYLYEKTVNSLEEAIQWLTVLSEIPVVQAAALPVGRYYVTLSAVSRRTKVTGLYSVLMFFMPESDYFLETEGVPFMVLP